MEAVYLLTDGKPDTSTSLVQKEVANMNNTRNIVVNTISFNCEDMSVPEITHLISLIDKYHSLLITLKLSTWLLIEMYGVCQNRREVMVIEYCRTANNFLKMLAEQTNGRYHRCHTDFDAHKFAHKLLSEGFEDHEV